MLDFKFLQGLAVKQSLMATIVNIAGVEIGGTEVVIIAGPCAVESRNNYLKLQEQ